MQAWGSRAGLVCGSPGCHKALARGPPRGHSHGLAHLGRRAAPARSTGLLGGGPAAKASPCWGRGSPRSPPHSGLALGLGAPPTRAPADAGPPPTPPQSCVGSLSSHSALGFGWEAANLQTRPWARPSRRGTPPTSCGDGLGARHEIRCQSPERWLLRLQRLKTETLGCGGRGRGARGAGQRRGRGPVSCSVPRPELWTRRHPQPKPSRSLGLRKPAGRAVSCLGLDLLPPEAKGAWPVRTSLPVYAQ